MPEQLHDLISDQAPSLAATLEPPRGYRTLAWLGLILNLAVLPLGLSVILSSDIWRTANIAVGAGAVLPTAALGVVASIALLRWRHWGQVLAIVALSLSLAISLPYGIVRLVLVSTDRTGLALLAPLLWGLNVLVLGYWCRPAIRRYLR
ncbi:MAG: Hepatitis C virus core protein [Synechococcaceae cyanobacterium]|nr:Hepatitis C virus core protein [Synechococcaceae cyanobacterium]